MKNERIMNRDLFRDKVHGCWAGKAIGGTLGAPYEWTKEMNDVTFYPPNLKKGGIPNDDLDLQLVWLLAAERFGALNVNERILAELWTERITGPWNEYGVCRNNIRMGLYPPLSGSCGNDTWKWSNGAWIRSEIWACFYPGTPGQAAIAAYADACCDHCGEGIYAEIFTAALESAAFVESDIIKLIHCALTLIPEECRIASLIRNAVKSYKEGKTLKEARDKVMEEVADLGFFQAPGNVAFGVLGLLYGEGDFGKTVSYAVNCGDDADCSGGFAGAVIGIILGKSNIPEKWLEPIGDTIVTCSIENTGRGIGRFLPTTLTELTQRVIALAEAAAMKASFLTQFTSEKLEFSAELLPAWEKRMVRNFLNTVNPYALTFDQPWGRVIFEFENGPYIEEGKPLTIRVRMKSIYSELPLLTLRPRLPESWQIDYPEINLTAPDISDSVTFTITPNGIQNSLTALEVELKRHDRMLHSIVVLPLVLKGSVGYNQCSADVILKRKFG